MKLLEIPGIGSRIRDRLVEHYGSEDQALDAIIKGDVSDLLKVVSERQALSLAKWAKGIKYGAKPESFLATEEAARIYQQLISRMAGYAHTDYARLKMGTLFPTSSSELIAESRSLAESSMEQARRLEGSDIGDLLSKIKPLRDRPSSRIRDRAIAVSTPEMLQKLKSRGLDRLIDIHLAESGQELRDVAGGYSHVCVVGDVSGDSSGLETAESLDDWYLVPEAILAYFKDNLDILVPAVRAARLLKEAGAAGLDDLDDLQKLISRLDADENPGQGQLLKLLENLDGCVTEAADWANAELKRRIESSTITLAGMDLLQALGRGEGVRELFEIQMGGVFQEVLKVARVRAASNLVMAGPDLVRLEEIFSAEVKYPLELNRQALREFQQDLRTRLASGAMRSRRELAREMIDRKDQARELVGALMEFDFLLALGSFAIKEGLVMPEIVDEPCLGFVDGRNLFLEKAEPVSYSLGKTGLSDFTERTVLLSGVNSGGKTSLLDLISQITILAHMGLPVPASRCRLGLLEELFYFSKSRGTLSAGAFETAMRKFAVVEDNRRKLVLADELEAITEPGASARIIACMLDELNMLGSVAVFVSHLAEDVKRYAETPVRVDGIEAAGLDADNNLVVKRTPRYNYLARSTPELILDRLVRTTSGPEHDFYYRLLSKFR